MAEEPRRSGRVRRAPVRSGDEPCAAADVSVVEAPAKRARKAAAAPPATVVAEALAAAPPPPAPAAAAAAPLPAKRGRKPARAPPAPAAAAAAPPPSAPAAAPPPSAPAAAPPPPAPAAAAAAPLPAKRGRKPAAAATAPPAATPPAPAVPSKPRVFRSGDADLPACPSYELDSRVTKTGALGAAFCLSASDLASIGCEYKRNPHYRSAAPMQLYEVREVWAAALNKHGGPEGIRAAADKRDAAAEKRRTTLAANEKQRRAAQLAMSELRHSELATALHSFGLKIRGDSFLCSQYIREGPTWDWPLQNVVRRMAEMKFLHEYTNYASALQCIRDDYRAEGRWWNRHETEAEAEHLVIRQHGGWPAIWPWLREAAQPPVAVKTEPQPPAVAAAAAAPAPVPAPAPSTSSPVAAAAAEVTVKEEPAD
jgi:hypothetical protein